MATPSSSSTLTEGPTPPGSWPQSAQEDGSDLPSNSLSTQPQVTDTPLVSSTTQDEPPVADTGSRVYKRNARPHRGRYEPSHPNYRLTREQLREIANTTLNKLDWGFYVPPPFKSRAQAEEEAKVKAAEEAQAEARAREKEQEQAERLSASESMSNAEPSLEGQDQDEKQYRGQGTEDINEQQEEEEKEGGEKEPIYSYAYDLKSKVESTNTRTEFYSPDDPFISNWPLIVSGSAGASEDVVVDDDPSASHPTLSKTKTRILIREYSTLVGAWRLHALNRRKREKDAGRDDSGDDNDRIGVLNFASAKKPGGGFLSGAQAQEESLARSSTLFPSLLTLTASPFYEHYFDNQESPTIAYYTHAMVYSPSVVLFRNDKGLWMNPIEVDILTSAAVNAGEVRERVRWEEEMREIRERWEKAEAEKKKKEEEEWEEILKDHEEMKKMYGDDEARLEGDGESKIEVTTTTSTIREDKPVEEVKEGSVDVTSGSSDTLETIETTTASSTQIESNSDKETFSSETENDKIAEESTPPVYTDPTADAEPVDIPGEPRPDPMALAEVEIEAQMQERIARILALFASPRRHSDTENPSTSTSTDNQPRTPHLILGSFGTGVFQNYVPLVARIFYDLIAKRGAPFAGVFDTVVFAILGTETVNVFREVFSGGSGMTQDDVQAISIVNGDGEKLREMDGRVTVVLEGEDEDESALDMEEEVGSIEEGLLRVIEEEVTGDKEHVSDVEHQVEEEKEGEVQDGHDGTIAVDEVEAEVAEIEMRDGTHDSDEGTVRGDDSSAGHGDSGGSDGDGDVEMLSDAPDDVHVHPPELVDDEEPTSLAISS